ncbi:MAG: hypothetical protein WBE72_08775 [Terracidiphilus sp.]
MGRKTKWLAAAAALLALSFIPLPYLASPEWNVTVVDETGKPLQGMTVRMTWENYSVESTGHKEDLLTNGSGQVHFYKRLSWASAIQRCFFTLQSAAALAHASFGSHRTVFAIGKGREGNAVSGQYVTDWTGHPDYLESKIVATLIKN